MSLITFNYPHENSGKLLSVFQELGETWTMFIQLTSLIGITPSQHHSLIRSLEDYQTITLYQGNTPVYFLNECAVYQLIDSSPLLDREEVKRVRRWVSQTVFMCMRIPNFETQDRVKIRELPFTFSP